MLKAFHGSSTSDPSPPVRSSLRVVGRASKITRRDGRAVVWRSRARLRTSTRNTGARTRWSSRSSPAAMKITTAEEPCSASGFRNSRGLCWIDLDFAAIGASAGPWRNSLRRFRHGKARRLTHNGVNPASRAAFVAGYSFEVTLEGNEAPRALFES